MAEWGKYLKNAVANVEQQLDKVLLENQNQTQSPRASISPSSSTRRSTRPDLQERLRRAAAASKSTKSESNASTPQPEDYQSSIGLEDSPDAVAGVGARSESAVAAADSAENEAKDGSEARVGDPIVAGANATVQQGEESLHDASLMDAGTSNIITVKELILAPDVGAVLNQARKIALKHQGDDTLELVDALEAFKSEYDAYDDNVKERVRSMNSKIAYLSQERSASTSGNEQRVALLLEEGQRLSQQELKLGLIIKRLRAERAASLSKETVVQAKDRELAVLRAEKTAIMNQLKEQEAVAEHFRGLAESASIGGLNVDDSEAAFAGSDGGDMNKGSPLFNLKRRLEAAESNHEVAKRTWHDLESSLLARIAELELNAEARATSAAQLQDSLREAQDSARETRNQMIALQDELDANQERWLNREKQFRVEIEELQEQLRLEQQSAQKEQEVKDEPKDDVVRGSALTGSDAFEPASESCANTSPGATDLDHSALVVENSTFEQPTEKPFNEDEFRHSNDFLNGLNGPVGPAGPFGSLADDFDSEHRPSLSRDDSRDMFEDSFSFMAPSVSRRESSIVGSEAVTGSQLHIVKKLTLTVRRLENELSTVRKACELSERQREDAQSEVVRLVDAQDNLNVLQQKYAELEKTNDELSAQVKRLDTAGVDKNERIEELEADVRDLKEMYREQVEALVTEIEELKK